jgi:hypothetical protein
MLTDTHPDAERVQIQILRAMPSWKKFELINDMIVTSRKLVLAGLHDRFPEAGEEELRRRLATVLLGPELAAKVYGPEPEPPTIL